MTKEAQEQRDGEGGGAQGGAGGGRGQAQTHCGKNSHDHNMAENHLEGFLNSNKRLQICG